MLTLINIIIFDIPNYINNIISNNNCIDNNRVDNIRVDNYYCRYDYEHDYD